MPAKTKTFTCYVSGCNEPAKDIGYACEQHQTEFRAKWKEEHTRKPGDKRKGWLINDTGRVKIKGVEYDFKIIDMSDVSRRENNYDLVKLELSKVVQGFSGQEITKTWVHPEPVQSYKLHRR